MWADSDEKRSMHHVTWETVCQSKRCGGLVICQLETTNAVALAWLCWHMISAPQQLWSQVLLLKYGGMENLRSIHQQEVASHTCRSIRKGWTVLKKGLKWQVGDRCTIMFLTDNWVNGTSSLSVCIMPPHLDSLKLTVRDYWDERQGWKLLGMDCYLDNVFFSWINDMVIRHDTWCGFRLTC